jgi:hypothetical protein
VDCEFGPRCAVWVGWRRGLFSTAHATGRLGPSRSLKLVEQTVVVSTSPSVCLGWLRTQTLAPDVSLQLGRRHPRLPCKTHASTTPHRASSCSRRCKILAPARSRKIFLAPTLARPHPHPRPHAHAHLIRLVMLRGRTLPEGVHRDHTADARQTRLLAGAAGGLRARVMGAHGRRFGGYFL